MPWMRSRAVSLFEPVYSEGGDTLYVMDQISDKRTWKKTGWRIFLFEMP